MWKWSKGILIRGSARTIVKVQCSHIWKREKRWGLCSRLTADSRILTVADTVRWGTRATQPPEFMQSITHSRTDINIYHWAPICSISVSQGGIIPILQTGNWAWLTSKESAASPESNPALVSLSATPHLISSSFSSHCLVQQDEPTTCHAASQQRPVLKRPLVKSCRTLPRAPCEHRREHTRSFARRRRGTYCHRGLQRRSSTVPRRWFCSQCAWGSHVLTCCWRIF